MDAGKREALESALQHWNRIHNFKSRFIAANEDPEGGEPLCGYSEWDEYLTDINYDLAEAGEVLARVIEEALA